MMKVDLNCDLGEAFGNYSFGGDKDIIPLITSANIACGFHAGDENVMNQTVKLAKENHVSIGAHPGLPDLKGFGRRKMDISPTEVYNLIVYQLGALEHGALYNMGAKNKAIAKAIAKAVYDFDSTIVLVGLSNSLLISEAKAIGLKTASEVFADRRYEDNGQLVSRKEPDAVITDSDEALKQVLKMVTENKVISRNGKEIDLETDTICVHGDGKHALEFVEQIRKKLTKEGIDIQSL